ncbi:hypothetical protein SMU40_05074, partial [Streptococcus mutans 15VF2]
SISIEHVVNIDYANKTEVGIEADFPTSFFIAF